VGSPAKMDYGLTRGSETRRHGFHVPGTQPHSTPLAWPGLPGLPSGSQWPQAQGPKHVQKPAFAGYYYPHRVDLTHPSPPGSPPLSDALVGECLARPSPLPPSVLRHPCLSRPPSTRASVSRPSTHPPTRPCLFLLLDRLISLAPSLSHTTPSHLPDPLRPTGKPSRNLPRLLVTPLSRAIPLLCRYPFFHLCFFLR
jgi:hypothetical protein